MTRTIKEMSPVVLTIVKRFEDSEKSMVISLQAQPYGITPHPDSYTLV